jgi:hypothetical protein
MLFALPGYQFPYTLMNRCLYLIRYLGDIREGKRGEVGKRGEEGKKGKKKGGKRGEERERLGKRERRGGKGTLEGKGGPFDTRS